MTDRALGYNWLIVAWRCSIFSCSSPFFKAATASSLSKQKATKENICHWHAIRANRCRSENRTTVRSIVHSRSSRKVARTPVRNDSPEILSWSVGSRTIESCSLESTSLVAATIDTDEEATWSKVYLLRSEFLAGDRKHKFVLSFQLSARYYHTGVDYQRSRSGTDAIVTIHVNRLWAQRH